MDLPVMENVAGRRFEMALPDAAMAAVYYRIDDQGSVVLIHTDVPEAFEGHGTAMRLAIGVFGLIRASGRKVVLKCPFMSAVFRTHPEYADLVAG